jgi:hypothetical protein
MGFKHSIFTTGLTTVALALTTVALAGSVFTGAYSHAARAEASGLHALTEQVLSGGGK